MRSLPRSAAVACIVLALLLVPWPGLRSAYGAWFRSSAELLLFVTGVEGVALAPDAAAPGFDSRADFREESGQTWACTLDSWKLGFLPTALFVSLWAAVPLPKGRRRASLLAGLLTLQLYMLAEVAVILLWRFTIHVHDAPPHGHAAFLDREWWHLSARTLYELVPGVTLRAVVPIVVAAGVVLWNGGALGRNSAAGAPG